MLPKTIEGSFSYGKIKHIGKRGKIRVGKYCSIADGVTGITVGHELNRITTSPLSVLFGEETVNACRYVTGNIVVGNDVWIGFGATLLPGINIGDGSVIGAMSVVRKDVAPYSIVVGNPAKHLRHRFPPHVIEILLEIRWWDWPVEQIKKYADLLTETDFNIDRLYNVHSNKDW